MRIVYVTSMLPYGPMEAFVIPEVQELRRTGNDVLIVPMRPRGEVLHQDAKELLSSTRHESAMSAAVVLTAARVAAASPVTCVRALSAFRASGGFRNFAVNMLTFPKALWLAQAARAWNADHIHAHWLSGTATMAYVASRVTGIPWSATAHRWDIYARNMVNEKLRSAAFVRAISQRGADDLSRIAGVSERKADVIHMGVPMPERCPAKGGKQSQAPSIIVAANLREVKGHRYLIDAARILAHRGIPFTIELAGDGPLRQELERNVHAGGLTDCVRFLGVVSHQVLLAGMQEGRWDVAVLPSVEMAGGEHEGIPVFLMEAMARGVPVVSTSTGSIPELLGGGAGVLVPHKDGVSLANAMEMLLVNPEARKEIGERGRRKVERDFGIQGVVTELLERMRRAEGCAQARGNSR
jgi:colanic acid/amylovoran biosynthesis glycosyltransferase